MRSRSHVALPFLLTLGFGSIASGQERQLLPDRFTPGEGTVRLASRSDIVTDDPAAPPPAQVSTAPEVVVSAGQLKEERPVGPYNQPQWTLRRRFPSTRVYVQTPPGVAEFEQWLEIRIPKDHDAARVTRMRQEFAFGLGGRTQLDLYMNTEHVRDGTESTFDFRGWSAEIRYALADWDEIPLNPTLYFEYLFNNDAADKIEPKLLLGGELAPGWHWGTNLIYERSIAGSKDRTEEYALAVSAGYSVIDEKLSIGPTVALSYESEREDDVASRTREVLIGPSIQWLPVANAHLDIEPLFGVTGESKRMKLFLVFGWRF